MRTITALLFLVCFIGNSRALTFKFEFREDSTLVGTGFLSFLTPPGVDPLPLSSADIAFQFNLGGSRKFTESDIPGNLDQSAIFLHVTQDNGAERLYLTGTGGLIVGGGLELLNSSGDLLVFEPSAPTETPEFFDLAKVDNSGNVGFIDSGGAARRYFTTFSIPVPDAGSTFVLLGVAGMALASLTNQAVSKNRPVRQGTPH